MTMDRRDFLNTAGRATIALGSATLWPRIASALPDEAATELAARAATDLAGAWRFRLNPAEMGRQYETWFKTRLPAAITLPGTTDEAGFGDRTTGFELGHLTRTFRFEGYAWYQRDVEIPTEWQGKRVTLFLERAHWATTVWLDETEIGTQNSLSTPHLHDLTKAATPGRHQLTIRVDNRYLLDVGRDAHSVTDHTQTNWNGIVGRIELRATDPVWIDGVRLFTDVVRKSVRAEVTIRNTTGAPLAASLDMLVSRSGQSAQLARVASPVKGAGDRQVIELTAELGRAASPWDEFDPRLYEAHLSLATANGQYTDAHAETFGFREISHRGNQLLLNDRPTFLRGNLECCIFPRTGYPPTDVAEWTRIYSIAKSYGLNHFRFHSYCPPEAAFIAADRAGFLLHIELPIWAHNIGRVPERDAFMRAEGERIQDVYGNHPSFVMLALGNELQGDFTFMNALTSDLKRRDPRRLYTTHADYARLKPEPSADYYVCQKVAPKKMLRLHDSERLSGELGTDFDFSSYIEGFTVPTISHEVGQWVVNPPYDDFARYTGPLKPTNLAYFRDQLAERGMLDQARQMTLATGRFAWTLYKEDIESALRTPHFGGIHLLQLQDFPGQGEALVGLLNALWDEKGIMTPAQFRGFFSETVPLLRMPRFVWTNDQTFRAVAQVRHHGRAPLASARATWSLRDAQGTTVGSGHFAARTIDYDLSTLGTIEAPLASVTRATRLDVSVAIPGVQAENRWKIWVFPRDIEVPAPGDVIIARSYDASVRDALAAGRRVLLLSDPMRRHTDAIASQWLPVFWSLSWFAAQPGTSSVLCDPRHPALASFPTDFHSDYQWRELLETSKAFVLNDAPKEYRPLIQVIDDYHRNHKLAVLFETRVGPGRLLASGMNLTDTGASRPVARQMLRSLVEYVQSDRFAPSIELEIGLVERMLG
ncbi:MAG: sugar-binding domain-containing protein [bacterium]